MAILQITGRSHTTLGALLRERGTSANGLRLSRAVATRTVQSYLSTEIDLSSKRVRLSVLEVALLYGYTLDYALQRARKREEGRVRVDEIADE